MNYFYKGIIALFAILAAFNLSGCGGGGASDPQAVASIFLQNMPQDSSRQAVKIYPHVKLPSNWQVLREWPRGEIRILKKNGAAWQEINFASASTVLALHVIESIDALFVITYDVEQNIPSGRALRVSEGIDIWRIRNTESSASLLTQGLPLGGVDDLIYARVLANDLDVCAAARCFRINSAGSTTSWDVSLLRGFDIVDVLFSDSGAHILTRTSAEYATGNVDFSSFVFGIVTLPSPNSTISPFHTSIDANCVPFRLRQENDNAVWSCASSASDYSEIFKYDLARQAHFGLMDIGSPNTEGRIAWGLHYSLNALIHLNASYTPKLFAANDWTSERQILPEALALVAKQGLVTPSGYAAKRYSLDRSPLLFALHLGRIAHLLSSGESAGFGSKDTQLALEELRKLLSALNETVEVPMLLGGYQTLGLRRGSAFWADGANVPYNYMSGYIHGLLASSTQPLTQISFASALLKPLIEQENLSNQSIWHYWWGLGRNGWSVADAISSNTSSYVGSSGWANITYRSMDAMAVLRVASIDPQAVEVQVLQNLKKLVEMGQLAPFVNQELIRIGMRASLPFAVARRYARSAAAYELQGQVFALDAILTP